MQQYADIYSLQNYSTCFRRHNTHHQEYQKLYPQPPVQVILLVTLLPSYVVCSALVCKSQVVFRRSVQTACCYGILNRGRSSSNWNSQTNAGRLW